MSFAGKTGTAVLAATVCVPVAAGQTDDGLRAAVAQGLEIALDEQHMAALVRQDRTDCLDPLLLQQLAHLLQLLFPAGLTGCGAAGAADQRDAAYTAQHRKHLLHGLFSCYDHMLLLKKQKTERAKRRRALFVNLKDSPGQPGLLLRCCGCSFPEFRPESVFLPESSLRVPLRRHTGMPSPDSFIRLNSVVEICAF